jgi:hypothetical protein
MLKFPYGFMSHFYAISEQMSPMMAWGFLGPDDNLRDVCQFFKVCADVLHISSELGSVEIDLRYLLHLSDNISSQYF